MKRIAVILLSIVLVQVVAYAQFDDHLKHHIIIVRDEVMPQDPFWPQSDASFQRVFNQLLTDDILREGDFISFVGFSTDSRSENLDDFTYAIGPSWLSYNNTTKSEIYQNWKVIMDENQRAHTGPQPFSMISLAKMYAFAPVKKSNHNQYVNRTFIIFISDHQYNGGDFYEERFALRDFNPRITPKMTQDYGQCVSAEYFVRQLNDDYEKPKYGHFIDLLEYIPLQSGLTLPSLLDYSAGGLTAQRIKGGLYRLEVNTASRNNPRYNILQLRYCIKDSYGKVKYDTLLRANIGANGDYEPIEQFDVIYDFGNDQSAKTLTIDAWASLNDNIYNATVLTPVAGAPDYLASKGLSVTIPINYEPNTKILGLVSLPGKLQFSDDQEFANKWVTVAFASILSIILVLLIIWVARIIRTHHITSDDITIEKV